MAYDDNPQDDDPQFAEWVYGILDEIGAGLMDDSEAADILATYHGVDPGLALEYVKEWRELD